MDRGKRMSELFVDQSDPGLFVFVEHWASTETQQKHHTEGPHIQHFRTNGAANLERTEFSHMLTKVA